MPHVLVAGKIHDSGVNLLRAAPDVTVDVVDAVSTESYAPKIPQADALLIRTQALPASVVVTASRLRIVSRHGVGFDAIDVPALQSRGIALAIVGDVNSRAVAEHTMALILGVAKRVPVYDAAVRQGDWAVRNSFAATELWDKCLFLVGFGRIGRLVAMMAAAFGMTVTAYDPFQATEAIQQGGAEPVESLADGLARADVVSLHIPKATGKAVIGASEFDLMKPGAVLINTARGDLVDEQALADALEAGRVVGAGLDVFGSEPPDAGARLLHARGVVLSPHSAALTGECAARMSEAAARNILDFFAGRLDPLLTVIPRPG